MGENGSTTMRMRIMTMVTVMTMVTIIRRRRRTMVTFEDAVVTAN